ncbi:MAG: hypothetical protein R3E42_13580 [Burkholderiaceae bacterium]
MSINKLKVGHRLYLGFALVVSLLLAMAVLAYYSLEASQAATQRIVEMDKRAMHTAQWAQGTRLNIDRVLAMARVAQRPCGGELFQTADGRNLGAHQ